MVNMHFLRRLILNVDSEVPRHWIIWINLLSEITRENVFYDEITTARKQKNTLE